MAELIMAPEVDAVVADDDENDDDEGSSCCMALPVEVGLDNEYEDDGWMPTPYPLMAICDEANVFSTRSIDASGIWNTQCRCR